MICGTSRFCCLVGGHASDAIFTDTFSTLASNTPSGSDGHGVRCILKCTTRVVPIGDLLLHVKYAVVSGLGIYQHFSAKLLIKGINVDCWTTNTNTTTQSRAWVEYFKRIPLLELMELVKMLQIDQLQRLLVEFRGSTTATDEEPRLIFMLGIPIK